MIGAPAKIVLSRGYSIIGCTDKVYITCSTYNYLSRGSSMYKTGPYTNEEVDTVKEMYYTHLDKEIALKLNRCPKKISYLVSSLGLNGRPKASELKKERKWKEYENKYGMSIYDILYMLYVEKKLSIRNGMDIELGCESGTISKWMKEFGIQIRTQSEENKIRYSRMTEEERKQMTLAANEHVRKHGHPDQIGRKSWCAGLTKHDHPGLMSNSIKHRGKNNPMANMCGELHPMWTGGEKYWKHKEWFEIREKAKQRDGYRCMECGITEEEHYMAVSQPLQVHHIIPYRECKKHELDNLITLCTSCHCKADGNLANGEQWKRKKSLASEKSSRKQSTISQY